MLEVDDFGNITRSASLAYPRRQPAEPEQARLWTTRRESSRLPRAQPATPRRSAARPHALSHASTPTIVQLDALARPFLSVADNGPAGRHATRTALDIESRERSVTDPRGVVTLARMFDMLGRAIHELSADAGETRVLADVGASVKKSRMRSMHYLRPSRARA